MTSLTEARGHISSQHNLVMFGGAGGQLGTGIAKSLEISRIIVPRFSSILSAYGMALADVVSELQRPVAFNLANLSREELEALFENIMDESREILAAQGFSADSIHTECYLNCRYQSSTTQLMIEKPQDLDFSSTFIREHQQQFGFTLKDRPVVADDIRVRSIARSLGVSPISPYKAMASANLRLANLKQFEQGSSYFEGRGYLPTHIIAIASLAVGEQVQGPAILYDETQTILIEPEWTATAVEEHVIIDLSEKRPPKGELDHSKVDPIELSVMGHRFMSIAEQMGNILRQTAISVNIKERLDFSCALVSHIERLHLMFLSS